MAGLEYMLFGKGPVASNIVEGRRLLVGRQDEKTPDIQFHFLPGAGVEEGIGSVPGGNGCTLNSYPVRPRSRGSVTLRTADARCSDHRPEPLCRALRSRTRRRRYQDQPGDPGPSRRSSLLSSACIFPVASEQPQEAMASFAREHGRSAYHPVGTCRMGSATIRSSIRNCASAASRASRVCDSSIMPRLISSNTNAATVMIAEKAADLIRVRRSGTGRWTAWW
jgi:choline dehydrogenase-like flavoprotein